MEDLQKQTSGEQTVRRRRAVRSVRMGSPNTVGDAKPSAAAEAVTGPADPAGYDIQTDASTAERAQVPPFTVSEPISPMREESQQSLEDALSEALNGAWLAEQRESAAESELFTEELSSAEPTEPSEPPVTFPPTDTEPDSTKTAGQRSLFENTEEFHTERSTDAASVQTRSVLAVVGIIAALLLICMGIILPLLRTTTAVMLYVDETAVGYIADAKAADAQAALLREELEGTVLSFDGSALYRCESADVRGTVSTMSGAAIYDALFAGVTEGYVRAYRLMPTENAADPMLSSDHAELGVLTEAEILSAIDAAEAICRQRYAANLPDGTEITVTPCFTWDTAWIAEHALIDEGALVALLTNEQTIASGMLSVAAELTETEAERIPYETTLVSNDENFDGIRTMISAGADGLAQVSYTISLNPVTGEEISRTESARTVVREPVNAVSYEGLYPLPDGVSTGTFDWPLPPLPDDDLPLDENGNPYVPENSLALKNTYISSGYGERLLWGAYDFHLGLDIVAPAYTEIYAADGGVVVYAAYTSSYGYMTRIRHANNVETVYAHQIKQVVKPGDVVEKGQLIGYVGSTGTTSGNHLHLEFRRDHVTVDPSEYITIPEDILVLGE